MSECSYIYMYVFPLLVLPVGVTELYMYILVPQVTRTCVTGAGSKQVGWGGGIKENIKVHCRHLKRSKPAKTR